METTFYQFGVEYLRWTKNGHTFEAVKEQVEFFGKEVFEQDFEDMQDEYDTDADGMIVVPEELQESFKASLTWFRDMEIM